MTSKQATVDEKSLFSMIDSLRMEQNSRIVSQCTEDSRNQAIELFRKFCESQPAQLDFTNTVDDTINYTYDDGFTEGFKVGVQLFRTLMKL